ncbi:MAG: Grx4 family monothiol glutaredoxin [Kofleriaceae bacterium]|nr:Grx4 family monothiol glutaredoxin [Myxococcales bacterium]MCB9562350.1 Grx4 family monothiol glutaredoxin [Kofleriaceae bacterium]MCB9574767.1 Grx4 family monothiol glutaredoxin [Kofleriaceae bacterium]
MTLSPDLRQRIEQILGSDDVVLFMKGTRSFPQCGFSARVVGILNTLVPKYTTVNILTDPDIRQGMKEFSDWPTFPQLYVKGELLGGADIVASLHESGDLATKLGATTAAAPTPTIAISPPAAEQLKGALGDGSPGDVIHLTIDERFEPALDLGPSEPSAVKVQAAGLVIELDRMSAARADGVSIDFVEGPTGAGFRIDNPNRPASVRQIGPRELKAMVDAGEVKEWFDVRTPAERATATIEGTRLLDDEAMAYIDGLPRDTTLVFSCHHGARSQNAAVHFLGMGFKTVYNLAGGIEAWSQQVDPKIPRY